jgi:hypothetical protein
MRMTLADGVEPESYRIGIEHTGALRMTYWKSRRAFFRDTEDRLADGLYFVASQHIERQIGFGHLFGFCGRHGCQERPHCVQMSVVSSICSVKPHP